MLGQRARDLRDLQSAASGRKEKGRFWCRDPRSTGRRAGTRMAWLTPPGTGRCAYQRGVALSRPAGKWQCAAPRSWPGVKQHSRSLAAQPCWWRHRLTALLTRKALFQRKGTVSAKRKSPRATVRLRRHSEFGGHRKWHSSE